VSDSAIQQMLAAAVARKTLPAATANTLYFVLLPARRHGGRRGRALLPGVLRLPRPLRGRASITPSCPLPIARGCLGGLKPIDALTSVCSHELAEAITDPVPARDGTTTRAGRSAISAPGKNKQLGTFEVQLLWSNRANACV